MKLNKLFKNLLILSFVLSFGNVSFAGLANDAKVFYNRGIDYYRQGQYNQAADSFRKATEIDPNFIDAYYNLGSLLEYLKQNEEALSAFKQIILRQPDDYEAVYKAAELSSRLGNSDKAKIYLSLIPQNSIVGQKAKALENKIDNELATTSPQPSVEPPKSEEVKVENSSSTFAIANPQNYNSGVYTDIASPTGVATDNLGNVFVAGFSDNVIYKITPDNKKLVFIKDPKIDGPIGIAVDSRSNLYIANYNKNNVLKVSSSGQITELIKDIKSPYCMYVVEDLLFVSSQGDNSVVRFKLDN